jgi:hypothetical protein
MEMELRHGMHLGIYTLLDDPLCLVTHAFIQFNLDDNSGKLVVRYVLPGTTPSGILSMYFLLSAFMIPFFRFELELRATRHLK